jgi:hypothetical protein
MHCSFSGIVVTSWSLPSLQQKLVDPAEDNKGGYDGATTTRDAEIHMLGYAVSELAENDRRTGFEL